MLRRALLAALVAVQSTECASLLAAETSPSNPVHISVAGRVVDPAGKPVVGARVILREWSSIRYSEDVFDDANDILAETTSAADGSFRFAGIPTRPFKRLNQNVAPWDVLAQAAGFGPAWVHLKQADSPQPLDIKLAPAWTITGQLIDPIGQPIADCQVELVGIDALGGAADTRRSSFDDPERLDLARSHASPRTKSNAEGRFELTDLPADRRLTLKAAHPQYVGGAFFAATTDKPQPAITTPSIENGKQVGVDTPVYLSGFQHQLKPGYQVRGRVIRADSKEPDSNAKLILTAGGRVSYARADRNGEFTLAGLPAADCELMAYTESVGYLGRRQPVQFTQDNREQEVTISLARGETIRGVVVDGETGMGVGNVTLMYLPDGGDGNWSPTKPVTTGADGDFEIAVPPGKGTLRVGGSLERHPTHDVPDYFRARNPEQLSPGHSAAIDVAPGKPPTDVRLAVTRGLVVRGEAVDAEGKPLALATVEVADRYHRPELARKTITDEAGRFELGGFPPYEEIQLKITDPVSRVRTSATIAADPNAKTSRTVELGQLMLNGTATITGTVLGDGKPLAGAEVRLSVVTGRSGDSMQTTQDAMTTSGPDGKFTLDNVDPSRECFLYISSDGYTEQGSNMLSLKVGATRELPPFELKSRSSFVAGIVVDPDGNPVPGVTVSAMQRDGGSISFGRRGPPKPTGPDGRFRLDDLPNVPLELLAYIPAPEPTTDRAIHFPARVKAEPGQTDIRILLDPKLQRPLP